MPSFGQGNGHLENTKGNLPMDVRMIAKAKMAKEYLNASEKDKGVYLNTHGEHGRRCDDYFIIWL